MGTPRRYDSPARRKATSERRKVVIIGGGGGLSAAQPLNSNLVDVTLIDRRNYHLVPTTTLSSRNGLAFGGRDRLAASQRFEPTETHSCLARYCNGCRKRFETCRFGRWDHRSLRFTDPLPPARRLPTSGTTNGNSGRLV